MTDIVERLRRINGWTDEPDASPIEAADEIERLRALIDDACDVFKHYDLPEHAFHYDRKKAAQ